MTTNPALRDVLSAFRDMVRARGPRECLEVASLWNLSSECAADNEAWDVLVNGRLAARAALRWWRWAERDGKVLVCRNLGRLPMLPYDFDDDT